MALAKVGFIVIDTVDPEALAPVWCEILGERVDLRIDDGRFVVLTASEGNPVVAFQRVPERKAGKNRMHLDLIVDDLDEATARIEALGGRWREPGQTREIDGYRWRCMADREDNEFDIALP
jgi:hypothetical protein